MKAKYKLQNLLTYLKDLSEEIDDKRIDNAIKILEELEEDL